jgi:hypothetical protein
MIEFLKNILTARDNETFSLSKILAITAVSAMVFNFVKLASGDYQGFGIGVSIMIAALAGKYWVEDKDAK